MLNKVFKAGLEEFKPKVKPCYSLDQFDFMRLLKHVSQLFYLDYREFLKFEQHILELTHLKSLELKGRDVGDRLQTLISEISKKFDKLTVFLC